MLHIMSMYGRETFGTIDFRNEDLAAGLQRLGFDSFIIPETNDYLQGRVADHALTVWGNPTMDIYGLRSGTPNRHGGQLPDGDMLHVDMCSGEAVVFPLVWHDGADPEKEAQAYEQREQRLLDKEVHQTTPEWLDACLGAAMLMRDTKDTNREAYDLIRTVPRAEFKAHGTDPLRAVFERASRVMRMSYGNGHDREIFTLASLIPQLASLHEFIPSNEAADSADTIKLNLGRSSWQLYEDYRGQEARTFQLRTLERMVASAEGDNPYDLTDLEVKRLRLLRAGLLAGYAITKLTPEVTLDDIKTYPSTANPRPDLGVPVYGSMRWLMGGSESGNTSIIYPGGEVYLGDMPTWGVTRIITPEIAEKEKRHGTLNPDEMGPGRFEHIGANGMRNPGINSEYIPIEEEFGRSHADVIERLESVDLDTLAQDHETLLRDLAQQLGFTPERLALNAGNPILSLATGKRLFVAYLNAIHALAQENPTAASRLFEFGFSGWGLRDEAEQKCGLDHGDAPKDYLMMEWTPSLWGAFKNHKSPSVSRYFDTLRDRLRDVGQSLTYARLQNLVGHMPQHDQLRAYVESLPAPQSVDQAMQHLLTHDSRFNLSWLDEPQLYRNGARATAELQGRSN